MRCSPPTPESRTIRSTPRTKASSGTRCLALRRSRSSRSIRSRTRSPRIGAPKRRRTKVAKYAQDLVSSLNGGKTLEDIAKDLNVEVLTSDPLKRDGITVYVLPTAVAQAFTLPGEGLWLGAVRRGRGPHRLSGRQGHAARAARWSGPTAQAAARALYQRGLHRRIFQRAGKALRGEDQPAGPGQADRQRRGAMSRAPASVTPLAQQGGAPDRTRLLQLRPPLRRGRAASGLDAAGRRSRDAGLGHAEARA